MKRPLAISFDLGQTLVELDESYLVKQARSQGYWLEEARVAEELDEAWRTYNLAKSRGKTGRDAWSAFMHHLLFHVGVFHEAPRVRLSDDALDRFVYYLWTEQPTHNLWRRPIAGIPELLSDLAAAQITIGVLTNSEGRAKELIEQLGLGNWFKTVVDSGLEGIEKPDPRIFHTLAQRLGYAPEDIVHVGDSYEADVLGALGAGMTPVWLSRESTVTLPPGVLLCRDTNELRRLLLES